MTTIEAKNEMLVMVLTHLADLCRKLAENETLPDALRTQARQFVEEFDALSPYRGKGTNFQHFEGEKLIIRIARFLPSVVEVNAFKIPA